MTSDGAHQQADGETLSPFDRPGHLRAPDAVSGICAMDATALMAAMRAGRLSSVEIVTAFLDRIAALNPTYNAIISRRSREAVLAEAAAADQALASGAETGPLHGLPIAIKDLSPTRGLTTTFGSPIYRDHVPDCDGLSTARIRAAGTIIVGKTNTPEFGLGSHTFNEVFGATGNAFAPERSAGGSSGGAAVAIATRMLPLADGSDMGGSLRNPAAFNNVYGLRPSFGRVPSLPAGNVFEAALATDGPMARTADDLALLLGVQAGADPRQPLSAGLPDLDASTRDEDAPVRIGWLGDFDGHLAMEPGILDTNRAALERIPGALVEAAALGFDAERLWQSFVIQRHVAVAARYGPLHADPATRALLKPEMVWEIENGLLLSALAVEAARELRTAWHLRLLELFARFDLLALPAAQVWPFPIGERWPQAIDGWAMDSYHRWMECVAPATLSGCPVLALPAGFRGGLSTGVQIIAPLGREADLLALARRVERAS
ncbi:amidase [Aurantimonas coralicida]|uniref:amidase n=1 Tax=Aurantimonas coralicida TaxID=182270 RepID=UPI0023A3EDD1|nr:amidase [Aurantimonas coralicida]MDE0921766.1 amidase [Aurantimonas coralicida]